MSGSLHQVAHGAGEPLTAGGIGGLQGSSLGDLLRVCPEMLTRILQRVFSKFGGIEPDSATPGAVKIQ